MHEAWKSCHEGVPRILQTLRSKRTATEQKLAKLREQLTNLDSSKLRALASAYVTDFLKLVGKFIDGTSEGNPSVNGQTLEEEKNDCGNSEWVDLQNKPFAFDPEGWDATSWEARLYGGQQLERLLGEFKAVAESIPSVEVTMDEIATAAGINRGNNIPNYAWAACDLATHKSQEAFVPLIETMCNRAIYIMKRLAVLAEKHLDSKRLSKFNIQGKVIDVESTENYPFLTVFVKDLFNKFVEQAGHICKAKCLDEFYDTRTIYWDLAEGAFRPLPLDRSDSEGKKDVVSLTTELFKKLQSRIIRSVLLKTYNFFLVPLQTELWMVVQGNITSLSDAALDQIFEITATKNQVKEDDKILQQTITMLNETENNLLESANKYANV
eukprot:TRINITY_DN1058_c0_g2_i2.p1 TRINITY_DN1058_c0_g2~~TRINITY_DN1058_c0_g2_i2.p1  ORF type:complete len:382 (+),score=125.15 TRINITY_DN1058_c0_g2_i2:1410-2555(+)